MDQYDLEWNEIEDRTKTLITKEFDPYLNQILQNSKLLHEAVNDIRNQEGILQDLQNAVFVKHVKDVGVEGAEGIDHSEGAKPSVNLALLR